VSDMDDDLDPRDELASAHLDGETDAEEAASVAADDDLRRRVEAFDQVRELVARPPDPPAGEHRDAAVAAALAAAAADRGTETGGSTTEGEIRPLPHRPLPHRSGGRRDSVVLRVAAAAAVVLVAVLALIPLLRGGGGELDTAAEAPQAPTVAEPARPEADAPAGAGDAADERAEDTGEDAEDTGEDIVSGAELEAPATPASPTTPPAAQPDPVDLGPVDDLDALVAEVERRLAADGATERPEPPPDRPTPADDPTIEECADELTSGGSDEPRLLARAVLDGAPVVAVVVQDRALIASLQPPPADPACTLVTEVTVPR
jgi:negative regulator of sigma E activity